MCKNSHIVQDEEGSALATVLAISVIVLLFIGAILSGIVVQLRFLQRDINKTQALYNAEAQVYRFLVDSVGENSQAKEITADSLGSSIQAELFGGFWKIESMAKVGTVQETVNVLVGEHADSIFRHAIVLGDSTSALTLTGNTSIKGNVLISQEGVRRTSFKGIPFRGAFEGQQNYFGKEYTYPIFNGESIGTQFDHYEILFERGGLKRFESNYKGGSGIEQISKGDTLFLSGDIVWDSFERVELPPELTIFVNGNMALNGEYYLGEYSRIIVTDTLIIEGEIEGLHLLFYAGKKIKAGGSSVFNAQMLSGGNIELMDKVYLTYPSLVYSAKEYYAGGGKEVIALRNESMVDGHVMYPVSTNQMTRDLFRVFVGDSASVRGSMYSLGQTEQQGTVLGSVLTHQFYFYESPTSYINWLKDVNIDVSRRPQNFVVPIGFSESPKYAILDWTLENSK